MRSQEAGTAGYQGALLFIFVVFADGKHRAAAEPPGRPEARPTL